MKKLLLIIVLGMNTITLYASEIPENTLEFLAGQIIEVDGTKKVVTSDVKASDVDDIFYNSEYVIDYPEESDLKLVLKFYNQYKGSEYIQGTREEFLNEVISGAVQKNLSYENYLMEYSEMLGVPAKNARKTANDFANMTPTKSSVGNILYVDNIFPWNHVAIYHSSSYYLEAPGGDKTLRYVKYNTKQAVKKGRRMQVLEVNTTSSVKKAAAKYAFSHRGKPYDNNFANNKLNTKAANKRFNCSELVYKAYRYNDIKAINLDSNGGTGVYPDDIYKSKLTNSVWKSSKA